ncbi:MAG TPA: prolyl oligopeptidase family serine peptidase [Pyrinomonadaceae bacterium]|nr:prolyl oligopeptidase family serine peptidase [Pyrinomonadaceae bacterium]
MSLKLKRFSYSVVFVLCLLSLFNSPIIAQSTAKRPITAQDFDSWRSLQGSTISRDGKFVAYVMQPQDGDGELFVKNTAIGAEWRNPRGYRPPTPPPDASDPAATAAFVAQGRLLRPLFSADSKFLFFNIEPNKADILKARKDKKRPEDFPKNALGIMDLATGQVTKIENVKNYQIPEDGSGFVAILKEAAKAEPNAPNANAPANRPGAKKKEYGTDLVLRNLANGTDRTFADVLEYSFSKDGKTLVYAVSSKKEETNGAFAVTPQTDAAPVALLAGAGKYLKFTWDEKQTQLAFISDKDDVTASQPKFRVYHWMRTAPSATEVVSVKTAGFRPEFVVSEKGSLSFAYDGSRLFLSDAPPPDPEPDPNNAVPDEEKVNVDLWHWKDDYVQPIQKVRAIADRDRSYRAVWHIKEQKFVQLADKTMENVIPSSNGLYAIGTDDRAYRINATYDPGFTDYYLVNTLDGSRKLLVKGSRFGLSWSPNGKYAVFFDGKDWNSITIPDGKITNLTAKLGGKFVEEDHDTPDAAPSYGLSGWTKDDQQVLINDRFDIWQVNADGSGGKLLTGGRQSQTAFRYVRLNPDERFIEPGQTMLLRAESEATRDSGFYRVKLDGKPEKLMMDSKNFGNPTKAKDADALMVSASRFDTFPDIWVTNTSFSSPKKMSDGDAQRASFNWGKAELVNYKNTEGVPLQGILIKPDNFDPKKKYPMLVYLYEKLSDTVHNFQNPGPGTSINFSFYASNGYVIFMPDIVYKIGYPGKSALNCVLPGIDSVVKQGFVDENNIGIQGHSWGGYQIAYMVTQTNRFKAAAPGALVANMFSAYNGIRWGTGLPRQFQYERTQSRIGANLWDATQKFMENSPLFYVKNIQTPILMIANDNDDAVPWYQGIEFYLSLRRLNKEVYMFTYNGEFHGLRKRQNQKDYSRRMFEFFENKLKGAPAPEWMQKGIPYLERDKEKEKYRQPVGDNPKK